MKDYSAIEEFIKLKFGNCVLKRADKVEVGEKVCHADEAANYVVTSIEHAKGERYEPIVIHYFDGGSSSYGIEEPLHVEKLNK